MPTYPVVCTLRIDLIAAASSENGCIDKFKVWAEMAVDSPIPLSFAVLSCPVALTNPVPFYNCREEYTPLPHPSWPFDALGILYPSYSGSNQLSNTGYAEAQRYPDDGILFEMWFHRGDVDISSAAFAALYPDTAGAQGVYHFAQATGYSFTVKSVYHAGAKTGFGQDIYETAVSNTITLASTDCGNGGGGGSGGEDCPCDWTLVASDCTATWTATSTNCGNWTAVAPPDTTWTKRPCH